MASLGHTLEVPESRFVDLDGPVHYVSWDGPAERTFVLVHGLGGSLLSWLLVGPSLSELGRVYAVDLYGFGRTERNGHRSRLMEQRALVSRFIHEVAGGGPVSLVGNSMGGGISLLQAALEPGSVETLVLSNSVFPYARGALPAPIVMAGFAAYQVPRLGEWAARQRVTRLEAQRAVELGLRIIAADPSTIPDELVRLHVDQLVRHQQDPDAGAAFLEAARSLMSLRRRPDVTRWILDTVKAPVLAIHGREDRLVPVAYARTAARSHPSWELRELPGVGHVPQMEAPERWLAAVRDWLDRPPV